MKINSMRRAFTLVEMLLVIAIISILAAMAISNFSNASQDTREVVARQQLAVVQEAVNHWVNREIGRIVPPDVTGKSVSNVMKAYNEKTTPTERFGLFSGYLDDATKDLLDVDDGTGRITSQAMRDVGFYMTMPNWAASSYPKIELTH